MNMRSATLSSPSAPALITAPRRHSKSRRSLSGLPRQAPSRRFDVSLQAKKKGFDLGQELLDVMEGGPKLRKWWVLVILLLRVTAPMGAPSDERCSALPA